MVTQFAMDLFKDPFFIGWDTNFAKMQSSSSNYPIYDLVKFDNGSYGISLAVAGFDRDMIHVSVENNTLTISGSMTGDHWDEADEHRPSERVPLLQPNTPGHEASIPVSSFSCVHSVRSRRTGCKRSRGSTRTR